MSILQATGVIIFSLSLANGIIQFVFCPFLFHPQNSVAVAAIHLPLAGTPNPSALQSVDNSTCKLQFIVFRNGKLFPCTGNSSNLADDGKRRSVSTPVAFTKLGKRKCMHLIIMALMSTLSKSMIGCRQTQGHAHACKNEKVRSL